MCAKSRTDYFKKYRNSKKYFSVLLKKEKIEKLEKRLEEQNKTKAEWLNEKVDEEISK